jgi:RNA 2',3'-cyclic 3'-phosphodiesterase
MKLHPNLTTLRVFLAVKLSPALSQQLFKLQQQLRETLPTITWVRRESIHLTLKFLGDVEPSMVEELKSAIEPIAKIQAPFKIEIHGLGVFPHIRRPRILWIGCTAGNPSLLNLVSRIEESLEILGFPLEEKSYHPHLTLARIKQGNAQAGGMLIRSGLLEQPQKVGDLLIEKITLFRSDLGPHGAQYTPLWSLPLG